MQIESRTRPKLEDLPAPPAGVSGWPWTEPSAPLPAALAEGKDWPRISLVTPTFQQGRFIERTLRSVLLQGYPNLEYFVVDGGSADGSLEIIRRYEPWLSGWVSEKDRGQSHAIAKGLARCTGELFNWINSDDWLAPGALGGLARRWIEDQPDVISGGCDVAQEEGNRTVHRWVPKAPAGPASFFHADGLVLAQPSTFLRRELLLEVGGVREDLHFVMDWELYLRLALRRKTRFAAVDQTWAGALAHPNAKTQAQSEQFRREALAVLARLGPGLSAAERAELRLHRSNLEAQELLSQPEATGGCLTLASLPFHHPSLLFSRFYWGALRRACRP